MWQPSWNPQEKNPKYDCPKYKNEAKKKLIKFDVDERTPTLQVDSHFTSVLISNKYNRSFPDNYRTALPRSRMIEAQVNGP
jgi:hypothetical protein